jgi:hypothetical protein
MDYFRSLGTSLLQQSGVVLPFALGDKVQAYENEGTIWNLYDGVKRVSPHLRNNAGSVRVTSWVVST